MKMKLIAPEFKSFNERIKKLSQKGDNAALTEEREKFADFRKKHGINPMMSLLSLGQIPFLITWFLSVRYMAMNPDIFPKMSSGTPVFTKRGSIVV
jgi:YidC/Oxa1 family membrane protein insertase